MWFLLTYALIFFYGFQWYAGVLQAWSRMHLIWRLVSLPPFLIFGAMDVLWNIILGSIIYLEWPFIHGVTFSQRTQYWYHEAGWRNTYLLGARNWASLLNSIQPGHIS